MQKINIVKRENGEKIFTVNNGGRIVGFIRIAMSSNMLGKNDTEYIIKYIYVMKKYRFKGYGRKLINMLVCLARENNISNIIVENVKNVSLQNFFFHIGYGKIINDTFIGFV